MCEENISATKLGFRDAIETRKAIFSIQVLIQRCRDVNCDGYLFLIDYQKAFDRVQHHKILGILKDLGLDGNDLRIISNLYWNQIAFIKTEGERSEAISIQRKLRQGSVLSPLLSHIDSEQIFREVLKEAGERILLNRENNIRYDDDTTVMAGNLKGLQHLMTKINELHNSYI